MRVVYVDVLFGTNLVINFLLLQLTARFGGLYPKRWRTFAAAALGALFAVLLFFPELGLLGGLLAKLLVCAAVSYAAFGNKDGRQLFKLCLIFLGVSFAFAGAVMGLLFLVGPSGLVTLRNGMPYFHISLKVLLAAAAAAYLLLGLIFRPGSFRVKKQSAQLRIELNGRTVNTRAMLDSGNLLRDPISGKGVIVVARDLVAQLFDGAAQETVNRLTVENAMDSFGVLAQCPGVSCSLVPFHTAGQDGGVMIAVKPAGLWIDDQPSDRYLIGVSPGKIETPDGSRAVMGI